MDVDAIQMATSIMAFKFRVMSAFLYANNVIHIPHFNALSAQIMRQSYQNT